MTNTALALPTVDTSAIDRANLGPRTKAKYKREIEKMHAAGVNPANHADLQTYADTLKSSRRAFLKSALRLMTLEIEHQVKSGATPENIGSVQAAVYRLEAMRSAVTVEQPKGSKAHVWLSRAQVVDVMSRCNGDTLEQKRDWIILGVLLGAGLRRDELANLTFDALKTIPTKNGIRAVLEVTGKGSKTRVIPINTKLAKRLNEWCDVVGGGNVARALGRKQELADSISAVSIFELVRKYGALIGVPELAAHDLRRTYAQLGYQAGVPITQISILLGHSSVQVTQKYLDLHLDLDSTSSDFIPL